MVTAMRSVALVMLAACANRSPLDPPPPLASPPLAQMPIAIDGLADEAAWDARAMRGAFLPDTEVRLLRAEHLVFVFVDVRDRDLATADHVELDVGDVHLVLAAATPPTPMFARTIAGTVDDPIDEDVGVRYELAIPFASLGPRPTLLWVARCEAATRPEPDRAPVCGQFSATLEPTASDPPR